MPLTDEQINKFDSLMEQPVILDPDDRVEQFSFDKSTPVVAPRNTPQPLLSNEASFDNGIEQERIFGEARLGSESALLDYLGSGAGVGDIGDAIKGFLGSAVNLTAGTFGQLSIQFGEQLQEPSIGIIEAAGRVIEGDVDAIFEYIQDKNFFTSGGVALIPEPIRDLMREQGIAEKHINLGKRVIEFNDRFIVEHGLGLDEGEEPTLMFNLASGATSLVGALGLTYLTRSPTAAAVAFGTIAQADGYEEARTAGRDVSEATTVGTFMGVAEGMLEKVGLDLLVKGIKAPGKDILTRLIAGGLTEGSQEVSQELAQSLIGNVSGIRDDTSEEIIQQAVTSGVFGALLGGPVSATGGTLSDRSLRRKLGDEEFTARLSESIIRSANNSMETELQTRLDASNDKTGLRISAKIKEDEKIVIDILKAFNDGTDITEVFRTKQQKKDFVDKFIGQLNEARADVGVERRGLATRLATEESITVDLLSKLETEGEQAFADFFESFTERPLSEFGQAKANRLLETIRDTESSPIEITEARQGIEELLETEQAFDEAEFTTAFESSDKFIGIEKRAEKAREQLENIREEIKGIDRAGDQELLEILGSKRIPVAGSAIESVRRNAAVKAFRQGVKAGTKFTKQQTAQVQEIFDKVINDLPKSVPDSVKNRFRKRIRRVTTPEQLDRALDKLRDDTIVALSRLAKSETIKDVRKTLKKFKRSGKERGKKMTAETQDSVNIMATYKRKNAETELNKLNDNPPVTTGAEPLMQRYLMLIMDKDSSTFEWQKFRNDLENLIVNGVDSFSEIDAPRLAEIKAAQKFIKSIKKMKPEDRIPKNSGSVFSPISHLVTTYSTILTRFNLDKIAIFNGMGVGDRTYRANTNRIQDTVLDRIKNEVGTKYISQVLSRTKDRHEFVTESVDPDLKEVNLTMGEAIQRWMELKNPKIRESIMEGVMGYTQENIDSIEKFIGNEGVSLSNILFDMYEESYDEINAVYQKINGVSLPKVDFYVSLAREVDATDKEIEPDGINSVFNFFTPSAFKKRTNSKAPLKRRDALDVFNKYVNDTQWYIAYAEWHRDITAVLADPKTRETLTFLMGSSGFNRFRKHIDIMQSSSSNWDNQSIPLLDFFRRNFTTSVLAANPQIGVKQLTSILAFTEDMPVSEFAVGMADFFKNPIKNWNRMVEHDTLKNRGINFNNELMTSVSPNSAIGRFFGASQEGVVGKARKVSGTLTEFMMIPLRLGDKLPIIIGGHSFARYLETQGFTENQALDKAMQKAEQSQQSTLPSELSLGQKTGGSIERLVLMFTSSPIALMNMQIKAYNRYWNGEITFGQFTKTIAIYQMFIPSFFAWVAGAFDTEPEEIAKSSLRASIVGPWNAAPLLGGGLEWLALSMLDVADEKVLHVGLDTDRFDDPFAEDIFVETFDSMQKGANQAMKSFNHKDPMTWVETMTSLAIAGDTLTAFPEENVIDIYDGLSEIVDGDTIEGDSLLKVMGFSDFIRKQKEPEKIKIRL